MNPGTIETNSLLNKFTEMRDRLYGEKFKSKGSDGSRYTQTRIAREPGIDDTTVRRYIE